LRNTPAYGWFNFTFLLIRSIKKGFDTCTNLEKNGLKKYYIITRTLQNTSIILINLGKTGFLFTAMTGTFGHTSGTMIVVGNEWCEG
jgi:hypothetical protein